MVVSGGPVSIPPNSDTALTFALTAGESLQNLEDAVAVAKEIYGIQTGVISPKIPGLAALYQNYPNPFNPSTVIPFDLSQEARVTVAIYNVLGQKVATITDKNYSASHYDLNFSANGLASGVYMVRLMAVSKGQTFVQTKKMVVLR